MKKILLITLFALTSAITGCHRSTVRGLVTDVDGEPLPGVAVTVRETNAQGLSNALGRYSVSCLPGMYTFELLKTGYAPAAFELNVEGPLGTDAPAIFLWRLPTDKGVFILQDSHYLPFTPGVPRSVVSAEGDEVVGLDFEPRLETLNPQPMMICHRMPHAGVRLTRLEHKTVKTPGDSAGRDLWVPAIDISCNLLPLDQPQGLLCELQYEGPLEEGVYGVHWGALDGESQTEPRAFCFKVKSEMPEPVPEPET